MLEQSPLSPSLSSPLFRHAVATPLTTLCGTLELCLSKPQLVKNRRTVKQLHAATLQLQTLIEEWTARSPDEPFMLKESIITVVTVLNQAQQNCHLALHYHAPDSLQLLGKKALFQDSLNCIVTNALEAYSSTDTSKPVIILVRQRNSQVQLDVIDQGPGMTIFEQRLAHMHGISFKESGTGLGLSMARYTIEQLMYGTMTVESLPGHGTRVTWLLPIYQHIAKASNRSQL